MFEILVAILSHLQASPLGEAVRNAEYLYAVLESAHVLGIGLLVGPAFAFDLRLLGLGRQFVSVPGAARHLLPVSHLGFAIAIISGFGLLSAQATMVAAAGAAPWKLGLLILACLNALIFHLGVFRHVESWKRDKNTPVAARISALISLLTWVGVISAGQLLAYT